MEFTTKTVSFFLEAFLAETEICDSNVTIKIQQDVFRLQIPVDNSHGVKVTESQGQLGQVELDVVLGEHHLFRQSCEEIPATEKVQDQVQFAFGLNKAVRIEKVFLPVNLPGKRTEV